MIFLISPHKTDIQIHTVGSKGGLLGSDAVLPPDGYQKVRAVAVSDINHVLGFGEPTGFAFPTVCLFVHIRKMM